MCSKFYVYYLVHIIVSKHFPCLQNPFIFVGIIALAWVMLIGAGVGVRKKVWIYTRTSQESLIYITGCRGPQNQTGDNKKLVQQKKSRLEHFLCQSTNTYYISIEVRFVSLRTSHILIFSSTLEDYGILITHKCLKIPTTHFDNPILQGPR